MPGLLERLQFDSIRCEIQFSKGVSTTIDEAIAEIKRLREENRKLRAEVGGSR